MDAGHTASRSLLATLSIVFLSLFLQTATTHAQELQLNGIAIHSELRKDFYIAALYTSVPKNSAQELLNSEQDRRMVLRILASRWSARSFDQHWTQSILINNDPEDLSDLADTILDFTGSLGGKLVSGDEIIIDSPLGKPLTLSANGVELLQLADPVQSNAFFNLLLNSWIGARPPSSNFKRDILQAPADAGDLLAIFEGLTPANDRVAAIQAWSTEETQQAEPEPEVAPATAQTTQPRGPTPQQLAAAKAKAAKEAAAAAAAAEAERLAEEARLAKEVEELAAGLTLLYRSNVMKLIYSRVVYPGRAIDRVQEGTVQLKVRLEKNGNLIEASLAQESKYSLLNKAALRAVQDAAPFPAAPEKLADEELELVIPIRFQIPG
ncbi:MAG: TonB family protein [Pseudomonadales bacterium]